MQSIQRVGYLSSACDNNHPHLYDANMAQLANIKRKLERMYQKELGDCGAILATRIDYTPEQYLCACFYKNRLFFGVQNKKTSYIFFNDKSEQFAYMTPKALFALSDRMEFAIMNKKHNRQRVPEIAAIEVWKKQIPLLDKIVSFEEEIDKLPERKRSLLRTSTIYDAFIDKIIDTKNGYCPNLQHEINMLFGWLKANCMDELHNISKEGSETFLQNLLSGNETSENSFQNVEPRI